MPRPLRAWVAGLALLGWVAGVPCLGWLGWALLGRAGWWSWFLAFAGLAIWAALIGLAVLDRDGWPGRFPILWR